MKKVLFLLILLAPVLRMNSQSPSIQWQNAIGGTNIEDAYSIKQTSDGGYIVAGDTYSNDGDISGNHGNYDYLVVKLNNLGIIQWQKSLGGTGDDRAKCVQQTSDGGYIVAGFSQSIDGNVTVNNGASDYWIVKLDNMGIIQWQKSFGGSADDWAFSIQQTMDGGYIISGVSSSNDSDVSGNNGSLDCWVVKITSLGIIQWQDSYGGTYGEWGLAIYQTIDGGYIISGQTDSNDGDISGNHGGYDYFVLKIDNLGIIQWQKSYGGTGTDYLVYSILQTQDKGYILSGSSNSIDGDITLNYSGYDYWVVKTDSLGIIQWQKSYGGTGDDFGNYINQTSDRGYILAGQTNSNNIDFTGNHGGADFGIIKIDSLGVVQWKKCLGGTGDEGAQAIQQTSDDSYIITGTTSSNDGDVSGNNGGGDCWVVKLNPFVGIDEQEAYQSVNIFPNPSNGQFTYSGLEKESKIEVFDITGKIIYQSIANSDFETINISDKATGIYFYRVTKNMTLVQSGKICVE